MVTVRGAHGAETKYHNRRYKVGTVASTLQPGEALKPPLVSARVSDGLVALHRLQLWLEILIWKKLVVNEIIFASLQHDGVDCNVAVASHVKYVRHAVLSPNLLFIEDIRGTSDPQHCKGIAAIDALYATSRRFIARRHRVDSLMTTINHPDCCASFGNV